MTSTDGIIGGGFGLRGKLVGFLPVFFESGIARDVGGPVTVGLVGKVVESLLRVVVALSYIL